MVYRENRLPKIRTSGKASGNLNFHITGLNGITGYTMFSMIPDVGSFHQRKIIKLKTIIR